jgi:predicted TIM-barrel fold metal-dependent hydrolase
MPTIDVQVHCYERNHPGRPWHAVLAGPPEVTGPDMIKAMDEVGVDGALLISVYTMYKWDASYAVSVQKQFPNRFALIKPVDSNDPKVGETIEEWAKMDGTVAVRIMFTPEVSTAGDRPSRARAAHEAAGTQGAVGRAAQAARSGAAQEHRGQDQRRLHAQS